jgi:hypothetical protein
MARRLPPVALRPGRPLSPPRNIAIVSSKQLCHVAVTPQVRLNPPVATLAAAEETRQKMLQQTGGGLSSLQSGASTATSLLSMIPGVGMVAGMFGGISQQAAMNSRMAEAQQSTNAVMATQQKAMDAQMAMAATQARHEHLVEMFLAKNCKLPAQP